MIVRHRWRKAVMEGASRTPPNPGIAGGIEGLRAIVDEYVRITETAEVRYAKRPLSLDAPISSETRLLDFLSGEADPTQEVEQRERLRRLVSELTPKEAKALGRIANGEPVRNEADKKARQRLRKKLRARDEAMTLC
jgi:hypothetical protein